MNIVNIQDPLPRSVKALAVVGPSRLLIHEGSFVLEGVLPAARKLEVKDITGPFPFCTLIGALAMIQYKLAAWPDKMQ